MRRGTGWMNICFAVVERLLMSLVAFLGLMFFISAFRFINFFDVIVRIGLGAGVAVFALMILRKRGKEVV